MVDAPPAVGKKTQDTLDNSLSLQRATLERSLRKLDNKLTKALTSNGALLAFGALWLGVGVILGTIAPEVKQFVNWLL